MRRDGLVQLGEELPSSLKEGERREEAEGFGHVQSVPCWIKGARAAETGSNPGQGLGI